MTAYGNGNGIDRLLKIEVSPWGAKVLDEYEAKRTQARVVASAFRRYEAAEELIRRKQIPYSVIEVMHELFVLSLLVGAAACLVAYAVVSIMIAGRHLDLRESVLCAIPAYVVTYGILLLIEYRYRNPSSKKIKRRLRKAHILHWKVRPWEEAAHLAPKELRSLVDELNLTDTHELKLHYTEVVKSVKAGSPVTDYFLLEVVHEDESYFIKL